MEDLRTNEFVGLDLGVMVGKQNELFLKMQEMGMPETHVVTYEEIRQAGINAGIPEEHQGAVFIKGEEIEVKGTRFTVVGIGKREITLRTIEK